MCADRSPGAGPACRARASQSAIQVPTGSSAPRYDWLPEANGSTRGRRVRSSRVVPIRRDVPRGRIHILAATAVADCSGGGPVLGSPDLGKNGFGGTSAEHRQAYGPTRAAGWRGGDCIVTRPAHEGKAGEGGSLAPWDEPPECRDHILEQTDALQAEYAYHARRNPGQRRSYECYVQLLQSCCQRIYVGLCGKYVP